MPGQSSRPPSPEPLGECWLRERALRYLDRFDSSAANLRRVLMGAARRISKDTDELEATRERIAAVVERLVESGVLNDQRFAETSARGLRSRGSSSRMIRHKLQAKGVSAANVEAALEATQPDAHPEEAELTAARLYVRRRRLGPYRAPEDRAQRTQRDLAALARAGFSYEIARRALRTDED